MEENEKNNMNSGKPLEPVVSIREWTITLLVCFIPLINIIMLLVWAFGGDANQNKANFAKVALSLVAIYFLMVTLLIWKYMASF